MNADSCFHWMAEPHLTGGCGDTRSRAGISAFNSEMGD
jgi:hypothetical protein